MAKKPIVLLGAKKGGVIPLIKKSSTTLQSKSNFTPLKPKGALPSASAAVSNSKKVSTAVAEEEESVDEEKAKESDEEEECTEIDVDVKVGQVSVKYLRVNHLIRHGKEISFSKTQETARKNGTSVVKKATDRVAEDEDDDDAVRADSGPVDQHKLNVGRSERRSQGDLLGSRCSMPRSPRLLGRITMRREPSATPKSAHGAHP